MTTTLPDRGVPRASSPASGTRLHELRRRGETARVESLEGSDVLAARLEDLGFWPGTAVRLVRRAPWGDPVLFSLRGFQVALRREEAARVRVVLGP